MYVAVGKIEITYCINIEVFVCQDVGKWFVGKKPTLLDAESIFQICRLQLLFSCCFCASLWIVIKDIYNCLSRCCTERPWETQCNSCHIPSENDVVRTLFQGGFDYFFLNNPFLHSLISALVYICTGALFSTNIVAWNCLAVSLKHSSHPFPNHSSKLLLLGLLLIISSLPVS